MNCTDANNLSIIGFLSSIGIEPKKISGNAYWYLSPLRNENTPSFKVDNKINRWYDHGLAQGGKLVDLGVALFQIEVSEFLDRLNNGQSFSFQKPEIVEPTHFEIKKVKGLENKALLDYLTERSIPSALAKDYCNEVYYRIKDKHFFAIGFENDGHGFEIRNKYFKACLGVKDITTIHRPLVGNLILFEGFMDFLSAMKQLQIKMSRSSIIILNSVNQIEKAVAKIQSLNPASIEAYFDNDEAGRKCFAILKSKYPEALDQSKLYMGYKDFNEMLTSKRSSNQGISM